MRAGRSDETWVKAFGRLWRLRRMSAWDWVRACHEPTLADVFPGQVRDSDIPAVFESALHDPDFDRRCHLAARAALERATGREWWWAYNLIGEARSGWIVVNGRLML